MEKKSACILIAGHYGSGKTEFADNLALHYAAQGEKVAIADLDIVNPFFRTRECEPILKEHGIEVYSSNLSDNPYEDTPGLAPEIASCFLRTDRVNIIDIGGDPAGARVLGRYKLYFPAKYEMWMVINANRRGTRDTDTAYRALREIEAAAGHSFTGLINNTHCCEETTADDLIRGTTMLEELAARTGLPVVASCYVHTMETALAACRLAGERFPMALLHRPNWMAYH